MYSACPAFSGGLASPEEGGGWILTETSDDGKGGSNSAASGFRGDSLPEDSPLVRRINEVLALPEGQPPVFFAFEFNLEAKSVSDNLISSEVFLDFSGRSAPQSRTIHSQHRFHRELSRLRAGEGMRPTPENLPELLFAVWPSGGARRVEGVNFGFVLRVETDASPQAIAVNNFTIREVTLSPGFANAQEQAGVAPVGDSAPTLCVVGNISAQLPLKFVEAAAAAGLRLLPRRTDMDVAADVYFVSGGAITSLPATQIRAALARGAVVFCDFNDYGNDRVPEQTEALLPVNAWSLLRQNLRGDCGIVPAAAATGFTTAPEEGLYVDWRYDLHLPLSPLESGHHRYMPQQYGKAPENTGWQVLLRTDLDGGLPLLVRGRSGRGVVLVFASDLFAPRLISSPGYPGFCAELIAQMIRQLGENRALIARAQSEPTKDGRGLALRIARHQPERLELEAVNDSPRVWRVVLSYRVNSASGSLLNKDAVELELPAGAAKVVELAVRGTLSGAEEIPLLDQAAPYLRVDAALLGADYEVELCRAAAVVCTAPAVQMELREETASYDTLRKWPSGGEFPDGRIGMRYVYRCGEEAVFSLILRNGLFNLAPLALAADLEWPENPTTRGLNDLSFSNAGLRGKLAMQGGWAGRQAAQQRLRLEWSQLVTLAGISLSGYGDFRNWNRNNPRNFALRNADEDGAPAILDVADADFSPRWGPGEKSNTQFARRAYFDAMFPAQTLSSCLLEITGLDPNGNYENSHHRPSNCSLNEWEAWGWPGSTPPPPVRGRLRAVLHDLLSGEEGLLFEQDIELGGLSEQTHALRLPVRQEFGPVRVDVSFTAESGAVLALQSLPVLFVPDDGVKLLDKDSLYSATKGLLCSPGVVQANDFGKGMRNYTQGWGGPHDQLWMLLRGLMEWGSNTRHDLGRMLTVPGRVSHYTNPWKAMPDGTVAWDMVARQYLQQCLSGSMKQYFKEGQPNSFHIIGSDRWNGIPVNASFGWNEYAEFDRHLRQKNGGGLRERGMARIGREIMREHAGEWQQWHMSRYAARLLDTQKMYAQHDIRFSFETHGSFPLCGGELGRQIALTHEGVGTDLFWELRKQDVIWSLGTRFGATAVNPDLRNGAYNQWGWVNSDLNNFWFANNSSPEPARRQWYLTYFAGQVGRAGDFRPYHVMGFSSQGGYGTIMLREDYREKFRVKNLTTQIRPERATGFGIVSSWPGQERRTGKRVQRLGFGIYPAPGEDSVDTLFAEAYHKLVKNGLPLSFLTSTDALEKWDGRQPLILIDGYNYLPEELVHVRRLNRAGAPIIAIGGYAALGEDHATAGEFFGVHYKDGSFTPAAGVEALPLPAGGTLYLKHGHNGAGPVMLYPRGGREMSALAARELVREILRVCGAPLRLAPGLTATAFISNGGLWLALADQGDLARAATVSLRPEWFMPELAGKKLRLLDMDSHRQIEAKVTDGVYEFTLPFPASGGRLVLICPVD